MLGIPSDAWDSHIGLRVPPAFTPGARSVLFIHGLASSSATFASFATVAKEHHVQVLTFDYLGDGAIKEAGERLAADLTKLEHGYPDLRIVIVAHSMGGLVARYALEVAPPHPTCVTDLFTLGTPHQGSRMAKYQPAVEFIESLAGSPPSGGLWRRGFGEAGLDLLPGSELLQVIQSSPRAKNVRYHVIAGDRAIVWAENLPELKTGYAQFLRRTEVPNRELLRLLDAFDQLDEIVTGKGDGAVSLASARLEGRYSEKVFHLTHGQSARCRWSKSGAGAHSQDVAVGQAKVNADGSHTHNEPRVDDFGNAWGQCRRGTAAFCALRRAG